MLPTCNFSLDNRQFHVFNLYSNKYEVHLANNAVAHVISSFIVFKFDVQAVLNTNLRDELEDFQITSVVEFKLLELNKFFYTLK